MSLGNDDIEMLEHEKSQTCYREQLMGIGNGNTPYMIRLRYCYTHSRGLLFVVLGRSESLDTGGITQSVLISDLKSFPCSP